MKFAYHIYQSPVGDLFVGVDDQQRLTRVSFLNTHGLDDLLQEQQDAGYEIIQCEKATAAAISQLQDYFDKSRTEFDLPLNLVGTDFQKAVWRHLAEIPYGECITYGDIAKALGKPGSSRAVGLANNRNPIPIIIPCHRVIGTGGKLVGFGGGLENKTKLLVHEGYYLC